MKKTEIQERVRTSNVLLKKEIAFLLCKIEKAIKCDNLREVEGLLVEVNKHYGRKEEYMKSLKKLTRCSDVIDMINQTIEEDKKSLQELIKSIQENKEFEV